MKERDSNYSRLELAELQAIFTMRREGKSFQQIGDILCRSKGTTNKAYNQYKHPVKQVWFYMTPLERAKYVYDQMQINQKTKKTFSGQLKDCETREVCLRLFGKQTYVARDDIRNNRVCIKR